MEAHDKHNPIRFLRKDLLIKAEVQDKGIRAYLHLFGVRIDHLQRVIGTSAPFILLRFYFNTALHFAGFRKICFFYKFSVSMGEVPNNDIVLDPKKVFYATRVPMIGV